LEILEEENRQLKEMIGLSSVAVYPSKMKEYGLNVKNIEFLRILTKNEIVRKELLINASYGWHGKEEPEFAEQVVRTQMNDLRGRLKKHGVKIDTMYRVGYRLNPASLSKAKQIVKDLTS
jgi:DNA-binding response OmpR family regulator